MTDGARSHTLPDEEEQFEHLERFEAPPAAAREGTGRGRPTSARSRQHGSARPSS
jgi:hypothetical protein